MKQFKTLMSFAISLLLPFAALSAEPKEPEMYSYATYFMCEPDKEDAADELIKTAYAPVYDAAVKDGTITGWGWLAHQTGGEWRRILYHAAPSVTGLLSAQEKMGEKLDKALGKGADAIATGCTSHVDYIWQFVAGSKPATDNSPRGKASMSVYMECDFTTEDRADEIVKTVFAPVYNEFVGKGQLTSWGWLAHVVGGKYRKLATMSAENYDDLLKARAAILNKLFMEGDKKIGEEFSSICGSHEDYLWTIKQET
ncbi:hypothetical protein RGQ13_01290 [Thalassotalea psychrophila]|uniref:Uncharacterized protein n=1 Tax=Thalassotalea psychrophila TaxID=3065647 RepID=A0ABY9TVW1_9GAMM|nr:hypothetical protein RGQ13_01290 [Colwelliaceae bacterium SQ149]